MPRFRRYYVPNAIVFVTTVTRDRVPIFSTGENVGLWGTNLETTRAIYGFELLAHAIMPDHIHLLLRPDEAGRFSQIMNSTKANFTKDYKAMHNVDGSLSLWQPRFWDHIIRDEGDLERHLDYIHYNPVKHGIVRRPEDHVHSSYGQWVEKGCYDIGWGWDVERPSVKDVAVAGEPL